jgi:hypothetical protein
MPTFGGKVYSTLEVRYAMRIDPWAWELKEGARYYASRNTQRIKSLLEARRIMSLPTGADFSKIEDRIIGLYGQPGFGITKAVPKITGAGADFTILDDFTDFADQILQDGLQKWQAETIGKVVHGTVTGRWSSRGPDYAFIPKANKVDNERIPFMRDHGNVSTVKVVFNIRDNGTRMTEEEAERVQRYDYITDRTDLEAGDIVVVNVARAGGQLKFVTVTEVLPNIRLDTAYKYIVDKVDTKSYMKRVKDAQRIDQIHKRMVEIEAAENARKKFEDLAKNNTEAKDLLTELDILEGRKPAIAATETASE